MKKYVLIFAIIPVLFSFLSCDNTNRLIMISDYPADYDITYGIRQVMQYDEVNINGIDIAAKLPFFETFRLTIHYTDSKISAVTLSNGDIPFSPYDFDIPAGKMACYLDTDALPNELRITGTNNVIAYFQNGELSVPFKLNCQALDYKYTFKSVNLN
ncbi:MAG: hypothetical protein LBD52_00835 [Prevotellaceae bacterium]|jgi:hypothetical protein|nr:hypothetical protein [Prevotellaceae bacterium]